MKCPHCNFRIVSFGAFALVGHTLRHLDCPNCGTPLRYGPGLYVGLCFAFVTLAGFLVGSWLALDHLEIARGASNVISTLLILLLPLVFLYPVWQLGRYRLDETRQAGTQAPRTPKQLSVARWAAVVLVSLSLILFMVTRGSRDLLLTVGARRTVAEIVRVHQPPPGRSRPADFEVRYRFTDEAGQVYFADDILPLAYPPQGECIDIVYRANNPKVSRIASQRTDTALYGVLFGIVAIVGVTTRFVRQRRATARAQPSTERASEDDRRTR